MPRMRRLLLLIAAFAPATQAGAANDPPAWTRTTAPFHIAGPIYYVGTEGIAVYLIRTPAGLILIDGGLELSAPLVERSIASLGMKIGDVRLMLATHAHFDHAAGLARLKRDSGARFVASAGDRQAYDTGTPPSDTNYGIVRFPAVKVDRVLTDGRPVTLGGVTLTPLITPGHTPGCTTWTLRVTEAGRPLRVVFPCSMTVAGNRLHDNRGYPGVAGDFRRTFARMRTIRADIVLPAHPEIAAVRERAGRRDAGDAKAFIDPELLPRMVDDAERAFNAQIRKPSA